MPAIEIPMRTPNPVNGSHGHWARAAALRRKQRQTVAWAWTLNHMPRELGAGRIRLTRISPGHLDDDNLGAALKSVRDEVARCLGINDRARVWEYAQERAKYHAVKIEVLGS
jgi:hypothetical protein